MWTTYRKPQPALTAVVIPVAVRLLFSYFATWLYSFKFASTYCQSFIPELHSETDRWCEAVRQVLLTLPDPNICLLRYLLRFLRHYEQHGQRTQCHHLTAGGVAAVFVPLLIHREVEQGRRIDVLQQLMSKLIHECSHVLQERWVQDLFSSSRSRITVMKSLVFGQWAWAYAMSLA